MAASSTFKAALLVAAPAVLLLACVVPYLTAQSINPRSERAGEIPFFRPRLYELRCEHLRRNNPEGLRDFLRKIQVRNDGRPADANCTRLAEPIFLSVERIGCEEIVTQFGPRGVHEYTRDFGITVREPVNCGTVANQLLDFSRTPAAFDRFPPEVEAIRNGTASHGNHTHVGSPTARNGTTRRPTNGTRPAGASNSTAVRV